ncbi:MAG: tungstate ABC transporter substrate-binding protein WtpA [Anaerolineales bacterium]|jgi:molybdate/tungstate transport system substrate-binding protein
MKTVPSVFLAAIICLTSLNAGCTNSHVSSSGKTPLVVFAAGSLIVPFGDIEKAFEKKYPQIDVQAQYHGSIQVIRQVTDLHVPIDVVATADASLLPMLMYTTNDPDSGLPNADWYIRFASNRLAIAYKPNSLYANQITPNNWYSILSRPDVKVGLADPRFDAVGYRALMVYALARDYYHQPTIFTDMFKGQFNYPFGIFTENDLTSITVPEIVETKTGTHIILRGASMEIIALLESGDVDYAFEYESVIRQHKLSMVELPDALNLGEEADQQVYSTVQVNEDFQRFASVTPVFRGERIGYAITIPSSAPHPKEAALFIEFLLSPEGRTIMQADSHPLFDPALGDNFPNIPASLQAYCTATGTP